MDRSRCRTSPATSISSPTGTDNIRLITVARPTITGEMHGILTTLLAGRGSQLTPIAAPIAFVPLRAEEDSAFGRIASDHAHHEKYKRYLKRTIEEPFALFLPGA